MTIISSTIPNLVNGISQQPYALRLASQAEEQVNGYSSVVDGLRKRPGTRFIKRLPNNIRGAAYLHTINRDDKEKYLVVIQNGSLRVFDLKGNEKTVNYRGNSQAYLNSSNPREDFRCVTVADYTFVLNTKVVVRALNETIPNRPYECIVWVKQGAYGANYTVTVDGVNAHYTVPPGNEPFHAHLVTTDNISHQLFRQLKDGLGDQWSVSQHGSIIHIYRWDGAPFWFNHSDSLGDNGITIIGRRVQQFSSLPARCVNGYTVEVSGDQTSGFDKYYVKYETDGNAANGGVWKETIKGGEQYKLDASTMPHALIRQADGSFSFEPIQYESRKVGDLESNPMPSFVGRRISDIFFHRNRLGFIADENVILSRTGDFFNFFRGTATAVLDDDPIDVGVSHVKVSLLRHAVPFAETLLLFSDQTQFQLAKTDVLTPNTVAINQTTEFECSLKAKPVGAGNHVYFTVNRGKFTGVKEYYVDSDTETLDANEITGHVPRYIPGDVFKITVSGTEDCLCLLSDRAPNKIFVYKYYWSESEKMQASWSHWEFAPDCRILNADFIESALYLVVQRPDGIHLEVIDLEPGKTEDNWDILVHLDQKLTENQVISVVFDQGDPNIDDEGVTRVELPYRLSSTDPKGLQVVTAPGGQRPPGIVVDDFTLENSSTHTTVVLKGDWRNQPFYIGTPYVFRYKFSPLAIREEAHGGGQNVVGEGRLQLRRMSILYEKTGYFRVEVTPFNRSTYRYVFSGRVVGSANNIIGRVVVGSGKFKFPLMGRNDQIEIVLINDSYLPCYFLSAEWEGFFTLRSKRL